MSQYFLIENYVKTSLISSNSVNEQFPLDNLKDDRRSKVFRSDSNSTQVIFDFGVIREVDAFMTVGSGFDPLGFTSITFELNVTDDFTSPLYSEVLTIGSFDLIRKIMASPVNARYARLVLNNSTGFCELSKTFIGKYDTIGDLQFSFPLIYTQGSNANVTKNNLGQRFIDEINTQKRIQGRFDNLTKEELDQILKLLDTCSITKPFFMTFDQGFITSDNDRISGYYYLQQDPESQFDIGNFWSLQLDLEEGT